MADANEQSYEDMLAERKSLGLPEPEVEEAPAIETPTEETESKDEVTTTTEEAVDKEDVDYKGWKKDLQEKLQNDYDQKLEKKVEELRAEFAQSKPDQDVTTNLEEEITKLATEKELDPEVLKAIIDVARKGIKTDESPELKSELEQLKADREEREQVEIFTTEWNNVLPSLKSDFPNASEEQLTKAKEALDELSHSEKYHDKDIDYVVFKEKEALGKILFSPKKSTFESARPVNFDDSSEEFPDIRSDMSPAQFDAAMKKRESMLDTMAPNKTRIMGRNASGQMEERYE